MTDPGTLVYVVDDDASVREGVARLIRSAGLMAKTFASAEEFLDTSRREVPSCLVLDVELPGLSGLDLQQELAKANVRIPIIFLTGRGDIPMSVQAMKAGAVDFLTKPFDDEDLLHVIRQAIARYRTPQHQCRTSVSKTNMKEFYPFLLDTINECLWLQKVDEDDEKIRLTPKGFAVLRYLVEHAGRLVTQSELLEAVWPDTFVQPEVLKSQVLDIRRALGDDSKHPQFIETLPRRGYQFIAPIKGPSFEVSAGLEQPTRRLVGRGAALAQLSQSLQTAMRGQRQIVFVTGEHGIGKTALADEFQREAVLIAPIVRLGRGQCVEGYGSKEPYYSLLEALGQLCRGSEGDSVVQVLSEQAPTWLVQLPGFLKQEHRQNLPMEILAAARERMVREICEALETIASQEPLLLVIEDLHLADQCTVDLISALARRRESAKLMLIGTCRPVDLAFSEHSLKVLKQDLLVHHLCQEIALEPLREADVAEYLVAESGGAVAPEGLTRLVLRHTEGNPLFLMAVLDHIQQRGLITHDNASWRIHVPLESMGLEVPETLRQMIEAQIDRLSPDEQLVLEVASLASVGDSRFAVVPGAAAAELEPEAFEHACEKLVRRHCILRAAKPEKFPDGTVSACYEFVHALCREVCYERIAPGRKANLHKRLAPWSEVHLTQPNECASRLAGHFGEEKRVERVNDQLRHGTSVLKGSPQALNLIGR
jgi:FixJ family two-component response regulator/DNA-binding winged helix-turn-helix (wHTH) protein